MNVILYWGVAVFSHMAIVMSSYADEIPSSLTASTTLQGDDLALAGSYGEGLTLAFFPESSQQDMQSRYTDITSQMSQAFGVTFQFETRPNYPQYLSAIDDEEFDIAIVNAFDFVKNKNTSRYIPVLSRSDSLIATVVIKDEELQNLGELRNKRIGFSSEYASASISGRYMFLKNDLMYSNYTSAYFNGHIPCLLAVAEGEVDACVTGSRIFNNYSAKNNQGLMVLAKGEELPQLVILIHPKLKKETAKIKNFFLALKNTAKGRAILDETYLVDLESFSNEKYHLCELILDYISSHDDF